MSIEYFWRVPTRADELSARLGRSERGDFTREARRRFSPELRDAREELRGRGFSLFDHLAQIARAADHAGFDGLVIPDDPEGEEPLVTAAALARETRRLKIVPTIPQAFGSAVYAAKTAVSFQRFSGGRLGWRLDVDGGDPATRLRAGDTLQGDDRHDRAREFLTVARGVFGASPFSFKGRFYEVENGGFEGPLAERPFPEVHLSGSSEAALKLSGEFADVHFVQAGAPDVVRFEAAEATIAAGGFGRELRVGAAFEVVARETREEALADASRLYGASDPGPGVLVGAYAQVAARLDDYVAAGIDRFVLSGRPALEEAYRIGEHVLPLTRLNAALDAA